MSNNNIEKTKLKYPTLKELKLAVLKGEYNDSVEFFSRGFLWKTVCLNSYKVDFKEGELIPVPKDPVERDFSGNCDLSKMDLNREHVTNSTDALNSTDSNNDKDNILSVIRLDVERLLIDPIFQKKQVQRDIIQILYNYEKFTPYKQGFHEVCGLVYLELYKDDPNNNNIKVETFNMFTSLMLSVVPNFYVEDNLIGWCISIFNKYLALIDPSIYDLLLKKHKIESQIWLIRWIRLIFIRELGLSNTLKLLDLLLCFDHDLGKLFPFIIIIFLIKIKIRLAECEDNSEVISLLLHYPHRELSNSETKEIVDLSIKLYRTPEAKLTSMGIAINKKFNKGFNWDKIVDLDRLRMEMKLQRRVRNVLKRK